MSRFPPLLLITLILVAGCVTPAPKEAPATIPATGSVEISSTPPGAEVYLDTVYRGTTPVTVIGEPGSHTLELRLRDHQSWSKSIRIEGGAKGYVDTALVPVPVITSLPTTLPTTRSTTVPTTRPRPTTEPTTPVPKTPAGCWIVEIATPNFTYSYTYELDSGGTGQMTCNGASVCEPPQELTWSQSQNPLDPDRSVLVTIRPATHSERVMTYYTQTDILAYGETNRVALLRRTTCP